MGLRNNGSLIGGFHGVSLIFSQSLSQGILNSGQISGTNGNGIDISQSFTLNNGITNNSDALIDGGSHAIAVERSILNGGIKNAGTLDSFDLTGGGTIYIDSGFVGGGIDNSGSILGSQGILIRDASTISGGIINSGDIANSQTSTATSNLANIGIFGGTTLNNGTGTLLLPSLEGGIVNTGNILQTGLASSDLGTRAAAIWVENAAFTGGIDNQGTITTGDIGIFLSGSASIFGVPTPETNISGGINNSGDIIAPTGIAISISGATLSDGIDNSGTITGERGISISGLQSSPVPNSSTQSVSMSQSLLAGLTGDLVNSGQITSVLTQASLSLRQPDALADNYGAISVTHGASLNGNIINTASGSINAAGDSPAIIIGNNDTLPELAASGNFPGTPLTSVQRSVMTGIIDNSGTISAATSSAIVIENADLGGITNNADATIDSTSAFAIDISTRGSVSDITNKGNLTSLATSAININGGALTTLTNEAGASITAPNDAVINIDADATVFTLDNAGTISGTNGAAINIKSGGTATTLNNTGTLSTANGAALSINSGSLQTLVNDLGGNIVGSGTSPNAIEVINGGSLETINNSGRIVGAVDFGRDSTVNTLNNSGEITGLIDFGRGGTYIASGGISGEIRNASHISLPTINQSGITTTTINGDLVFNGSLSVTTNTSVSTVRYGQLNVTGSADLSNASVDIQVTGDEFVADQSQFTFVTSGGPLTTTTTAATDNSALLSFELENTGNAWVATATRESITDIIDDPLDDPLDDIGDSPGDALGDSPDDSTDGPTTMPGFGITGNSIGRLNLFSTATALEKVIEGINSGEVSATGELASLINEISALGTAEEVAQAVATLDPDTADRSRVGALAADSAAAKPVYFRLVSLRGNDYGGAAGDARVPMGVWSQAYYNKTEQDPIDDVDGFDAETVGIAAGIDGALTPNTVLGAAISHTTTDVDSILEHNTIDIDHYRLTLYGSYNAETYYLDTQLSYALNNYETERSLFGGRMAQGDHDGDQYGVRLRGGYPISFGDGWVFTPRLTMEYVFISEDPYTETGAGDAGLRVDTEDVEVFLTSLSGKLAFPFTTENNTTWIPEVSLDFQRDLIGDEVELDSNFIGAAAAAFQTNGANVEQTGIKSSFYLRSFGEGPFSVSVGYDYLYKKDYESHSLNALLRYDF